MTEDRHMARARALVDQLAEGASADRALAALHTLHESGPAARRAVLEGLGDGRWVVRRGCLWWLLRHPDLEGLRALVPLLHDPRAGVRKIALHSLVADVDLCHAASIDPVPLLVERVHHDASPRVRRHAVMLLATRFAHPHLVAFFQHLLDTERDPRLHKFAGIGWWLSRQASHTDEASPTC